MTAVPRLHRVGPPPAALDGRQFVLHYQPKISIATGELVGAEGLLCWNDPQRGIVPPAVFLPVLESTGLIVDVGEWEVRQAARDLARWSDLGLKPIRLAVDVSPLQPRAPEFCARFLTAAGRAPGGVGGIDIEITEGALLDDTVFLSRRLQVLRDEGVRVAIDDFGAGYSSLSRLADLPVDTLKIDRSFISRLAGDKTVAGGGAYHRLAGAPVRPQHRGGGCRARGRFVPAQGAGVRAVAGLSAQSAVGGRRLRGTACAHAEDALPVALAAAAIDPSRRSWPERGRGGEARDGTLERAVPPRHWCCGALGLGIRVRAAGLTLQPYPKDNAPPSRQGARVCIPKRGVRPRRTVER